MAEQDTLLTMLKTDLGMSSTGYDVRLTQIIEASKKAIIAEGVSTLNASEIDDAQLITMYAAWLWRNRDTGEGMSRMLRLALNNRIFSEKMRG